MILERIVKHRWFGFADLACALASIALWELEPGWSPLLIALLPWFLRLSAGYFPFQRTRFELPLAIFLLTAAIGVWAAYSQEDARAKFWLLTGGILLYYSLAGQPQDNLWTIAGLLSLLGVGISCLFLFTNDWQQYPAKISLLNLVGLLWMKVRPPLRSIGMHPNGAAGVMALTTPFLVAIGVNTWKEKRILMGIGVVVGGSLISAGLLLATSRGASLALATGMGIWLLWVLSNWIHHFIPGRPKTIFSVGLILLIIVIAGFALLSPGSPIGLVNSIPGPPNTGSRLELANSALELVGDFPFTGGGLHSFSGLYSDYVRGIPHFITNHSHNHYLDMALEQGVLGMLAFCFVYLESIWLIVTHDWKTPRALLVWASFASLLVVVLHGLVDDLVYNRHWGAALVFVLPGIAYAMARSSPKTKTQHPSTRPLVPGFTTGSRYRQSLIGAAAVAFLALLMLVYGYRQPLLAAWYADLGAVQMARTGLAGFPPASRPEGYDVAELEPAKRLFLQALQYDTRNRTANHRLGLIALGRRDYPAAVFYLETAYQADKNHQGIRKALGYSYVWSGQFDQAIALLANSPEASYELRHYAEWWGTQGQDDLAERAETMTKRLGVLELPPPTGEPTGEPIPTELGLDCCQCTALGREQYVPVRKQPGYTCAESCFQGCLELGLGETECKLGQVGGYAVTCPTGGPTVEPTPTATLSLTPETAWTGWVESNTTDPAAGGIGVLRVSVDGLVDLPVTIRASAGWSATNWTGTKTEYGPYFCEFAPLPTETFTVIPEGLGVSVQVPLHGPGVAVVQFAQHPVSTPTPMTTSTATTSPQQTPTVSEPTPTELGLDCCQCTALGRDQYVPVRKQPGYTCAESCFQGCLELGFGETECKLGQVGGYAVVCPAAP